MTLDVLPTEILLHVLEHGTSEEIYRRPDYFPDPENERKLRPWEKIFNPSTKRRRKPFCALMARVSKLWLNIVQSNPSCWYIQVHFPAVRVEFKYDLAKDIAQCVANLKESEGCDLSVTIGCTAWMGYGRDLTYFSSSGSGLIPKSPVDVDGMQHRLLLSAIARLRPYANRIVELFTWTWDGASMAAVITLLRSFGPMPRLRQLQHRDHWEWFDEETYPVINVASGALHEHLYGYPYVTETVNLSDFGFLATLNVYYTGVLTPETRLPPNLSRLDVGIWHGSLIDSLTWDIVEGALRQCPGLQHLTLRVFRMKPSSNPWGGCDPNKQKIHLPNLRTLILEAECNMTLILQSTIVAPKVHTLTFGLLCGPLVRWEPNDDVLWYPGYSAAKSVRFPALQRLNVTGIPIGTSHVFHSFHHVAVPLKRLTFDDGNDWSAAEKLPMDQKLEYHPIVAARDIKIIGKVHDTPVYPLQRAFSNVDLSGVQRISLQIRTNWGDKDYLGVVAEITSPEDPLSSSLEQHFSTPCLRSISLRYMYCIHVAELVLGRFAGVEKPVKVKISKLKRWNCTMCHPPHWQDNPLPDVRILKVGLEDLMGVVRNEGRTIREPSLSLTKVQSLSIFSSIQALEITNKCDRNEACIYDASTFRTRLANLSQLCSSTSLPHLCHLTIGLSLGGCHGYKETSQFPSRKILSRMIMQTVRSIIEQREKDAQRLQQMSEVYLLFTGTYYLDKIRSGIGEIPLRVR